MLLLNEQQTGGEANEKAPPGKLKQANTTKALLT